uniref:glucuronosyltransferase n=1 Tax=Panagrolaimus superbus TaxID=310955 RepID=A0A914YB75_9BILA
MRFLFLFLFLNFHIPLIFSYKAIIFTFHDTGSHQGSLSKLFLKLASDGYNVTVFDTTSKSIPNYGPNIEIIDGRTNFIPRIKYNVSELVWKSFPDFTSLVRLYNIGDKYFQTLIEQKPEIVSKVLNDNYDIVILGDLFSTHGIFFAETLKATKNIPYILYGTTLQLHFVNSALGFGRHYLSRPSSDGDITKVFDLHSFWIRFDTFCSAFIEHFALSTAVDFVIPTLKSFGASNFDFVKFHSESSFFMSEAFDRLGLPLAEVTGFKGVGPNCPKVGKLSSSLEAFVNDPNSKGTIFIAFGSHAKWDIAPEYITKAFFEAFSNLTDYRFIFRIMVKLESFQNIFWSLNGPPKKRF